MFETARLRLPVTRHLSWGLPLLVMVVGGAGGCTRRTDTATEWTPAAWTQIVAPEKLGRLYCGRCHLPAQETWARSLHSKANREVHPLADAAMFSGQTARTHAADYRFETDAAGRPLIREQRRDSHALEHRPDKVIARTPLWQYVIETEPGRFQCTDVAWDPNKLEWFSVFGDEERNPGEWGHWSGRGMNWNSMCAHCHMTGFAKNYDPTTDRYASRWIEHGIGCVQCHNAMPGHEPGGEAMAGIDNFGRDPKRMMDTCASCHSRAEQLTTAFVPGEVFDDHYRLQLPVDPRIYHADGQVLDEDFEYGSFRHSRMHAAGVTCMDCHDSHSSALKLPEEDNQVCMQCHTAPGRLNAPIIEPTAHSFHKPESTGNRCVECHMVKTTYMQRDPRRDHGFVIPDPMLTREIGVPNACSRCHTDQSLEWNVEAYEKWYGAKMAGSRHRERARAVAAAFRDERAIVPRLLALIDDEKVPAWRASLLTLADQLTPGDPPVVAKARGLVADPEPLIRTAAVRALAGEPSARSLLQAALRDQVRLVRLEAAWAMSSELAADSPERHELDAYLAVSLDQPGGRLRLAQDLFNRGRRNEAIAHVRTALPWDPLTPALPESLGFMLSAQGRPVEAAHALDRAVGLAANDARLALHAALAWSEAGDLSRAETMLGTALRRDPKLDRAWYNLGLLQVQTGRAEQAIVSLREAERLSPTSADAPYALATVFFQLDRMDDAAAAARRALAADANHAPAAELLKQVESAKSR